MISPTVVYLSDSDGVRVSRRLELKMLFRIVFRFVFSIHHPHYRTLLVRIHRFHTSSNTIVLGSSSSSSSSSVWYSYFRK